MTTSDIGEAARIAYAAGIDPVSWAEGEICGLIGVHVELVRLNLDLGVEPGGDLSIGAMTRRILGLLLNGGWKPPAATTRWRGCDRADLRPTPPSKLSPTASASVTCRERRGGLRGPGAVRAEFMAALQGRGWRVTLAKAKPEPHEPGAGTPQSPEVAELLATARADMEAQGCVAGKRGKVSAA